jgi:hypothetical protein
MPCLFSRLQVRVKVVCGDWRRVLTYSPTTYLGVTGILLDPPYSAAAGRKEKLYSKDDYDVAHDVREWALEHGDDPLMRIALCGLDGEHEMPETWECVPWKAVGGYSSISIRNNDGKRDASRGAINAQRERIWFSPHCLRGDREASLFDAAQMGAVK